jgi:hypothetical protein
MHVLGQEMLGELAGKRHQVVVRNRAGDDDLHSDFSFLSVAKKKIKTTCWVITVSRVLGDHGFKVLWQRDAPPRAIALQHFI